MTGLRARQRQSLAFFKVGIPVSSDGTVGRRCPSCRRYFKVNARALGAIGRMWCPYCGAEGDRDEFMSLDQRRRVLSAARQYALGQVGGMLDGALQSLNRLKSGPIQVRFEKGRVEIPPLLTYLEKETVRRKRCVSCGEECAVFGIAVGCPICGRRDPLDTFLESFGATRAVLASLDQLPAASRRSLEAGGGEDRLVENTLGDAVSAFEVFCKSRYSEVRGLLDLATLLRERGRNVFQRLFDAVAIMEAALQRSVGDALTKPEWDELSRAFATRHVHTHNFGIADESYRSAGGQTPLGQRVQVTRTTVEYALSLTERLVTAMA